MAVYDLDVINDRVSPDPFSYSIELDGIIYALDYTYNRRIDTWFITISNDASGVTIGPCPLLTSKLGIFRRYVERTILPSGDIFVNQVDESLVNESSLSDPGLDDFGVAKKPLFVSVFD